MPGVANLEGTKVNSLKVGRMVSRHPAPRYETECEVCGAKRVFAHAALTTGASRCVADGCGREGVGKHLRETARQFKAKVQAEEAARRLEAEQREREADAQARQEAEAARRQRMQAFKRNEVTTGRDVELYVSDELRERSMPKDEAAAFNKEQSDIFVRETPEYSEYKSDKNADAILDYLDRNGVRIFDSATLRAAFFRLRDLGMIQPRPAAAPAEPAKPAPTPKFVNLTIEQSGPKTYIGKDWQTGRKREFTQREVDRMSSTDFARAFEVAHTFAETFTAMREERQ